MHDEKRTFLMRYRKTIILIDRLNNKLKVIDDRLGSISSPDLTGTPRGGPTRSKYDIVDEKCDIEVRIEHLNQKAKAYRTEILAAIDTLDDMRYIDVCELYFIRCLSFESIAVKLGYSERHIRRLYAEALDLIDI